MSVDVMPVLPGSSPTAPAGRSGGRDRQDSGDAGESFASMVGRLVDHEPRKQAATAPARIRSTAAPPERSEVSASPSAGPEEPVEQGDATASAATPANVPQAAEMVGAVDVTNTPETDGSADASVAALGLILCAQNVPERDAPPPAVTTCVLPAPGAEAPATNQPEEQVEVVPSLETAFPPQPLSEGVEQPPPAVRTPETSRDHESSRSFDLPPQGVSRFGGRTLLTASQATVGVPTEDDAATETTAGVAAPVVQDEPLPIEITPRDVDSQAFEAGRTTGRAPSLATRPKGEVPTASAPETMTAPPVKRAPAEAASGPAPGASAAPSTVDGSTPAPDAALSTPGSAEARRADVPSRLAANRLSSFNEARPRARAVLGAEQVWNAWQTESINSSTIARAVTAAAAAIRLEADVFPTKAAAVAQPMGPAAGVPFTSIVPAELKPVESAAQTAATNVATRAAEPIDVPSQIVRSAQLQWRDGVGEAKLKLTPENLGEVTISLRVEQGSVFATVRAESAAAMQAIQARQQELQSALEAQGLHLDHLILSTDPDRQRDQQQPQHRAPKRAHLKPQANESGETPRFEILA